jgi:hypothetical protein
VPKFDPGLRRVLAKLLRGKLKAQHQRNRLLRGCWLEMTALRENFGKGFNFNPVHRLTELDASGSLVED